MASPPPQEDKPAHNAPPGPADSLAAGAIAHALFEHLAAPLRSAPDATSLARATTAMRAACRRLFDDGLGVEALTSLMSALNDVAAARVIRLTEETLPPPGDYCWLAFGSEGRGEQTFATDQDNGIIFVPDGPVPDAQRRAFTTFASAVNRTLDACGFPLCKGNTMARNPEWCLTPTEWRARFRGWMQSPTPDSLVFANIFFDFRPIAGHAPLAATLRGELRSLAQDNRRFLRAMAANALEIRPPIGRLRRFVLPDGPRSDYIDLKRRGIRLFVDIARIRALAAGVTDTGTVSRLRATRGSGANAARAVEGEIAAFATLQRFRLRNQLAADIPANDPNLLRPDDLHDFDQRLLHLALRQLRAMQAALRQQYAL